MNNISKPPSPAVSLIVLAAGLGSRFGGGKQLAEVGPAAAPLMYYSIMDAWRAGIEEVSVIVSATVLDEVRQNFLPRLPEALQVELVVQETADIPMSCPPASREKPWGTGHALWCARESVSHPFIVINADDYYGPTAMQIVTQHFQRSNDWAMLCYPLDSTLSEYGGVNRGLCRIEHGCLARIEECIGIRRRGDSIHGSVGGADRELRANAPISMNLWGFTRNIFHLLESALVDFLERHADDDDPEFLLPEQVLAGIAAGHRVRVYHSDEQWLGMTYPRDLETLNARLPAALGGAG